MSPIDTGGPAFPVQEGIDGLGYQVIACSGMTLRDWFAGQALPAVIASAYSAYFRGEKITGEEFRKTVAQGAYVMADAMLAERLK